MPVLLAIVGAITAVLYFVIRARNAADAAGDLIDMANDVRLAARRFGFRRNADIHPAESIEEPSIAIAGIASAFLELDDLPTSEQRSALTRSMGKTLNLSKQDADELAILGRWMASECGSPDAAISRLSRKLVRMAGQDVFTPLLSIVNATLTASSTSLNTQQKEALDDVKRAFRIT
ncbi:hypothetical protein RXV86_16390 [Alisedimentitalea sp. MJ-SS2]|uniref:hypothetical protein n=1 Tax=Aliisedimentitalea sp. MJ-SS2 TaxID=3049795 RepID=UPI0029151AE4|nr:hypothetical protein [Alisedimentitalea sp. MJ-SS2]MDU8928974.1 hypothetical protein [Alisedimentitalea sp. MJ-SS2]